MARWRITCLLMLETWVRSLGCKDPLEKEMVTCLNILAWEIQRSLEGYGSRRCKELDTAEHART